MPVFEYSATNAEGQQVKGTLLSQSLVSAAEDLARQGYQVEQVSLSAVAGDPIPADFRAGEGSRVEQPRTEEDITAPRSYVMTDIVGPLVNRVPLSQLLFFFRQLSTMLNAGVGM